MQRGLKILTHTLITGFFVLCAHRSLAATLNIIWSASISCTDGTAINNCPVIAYTVYSALQGQPKTVLARVAATTLTFAAANTPPGNWCLTVSASSTGGEGPQSNEACFQVPAPLPGAPGTPQLSLGTSTTIAYVPVLGHDRLTFLIVGTVPLGTPCDVRQPDGPFFVIPRASVTWEGPAKPSTVVGACS
jgi:hypothetical protein